MIRPVLITCVLGAILQSSGGCASNDSTHANGQIAIDTGKKDGFAPLIQWNVFDYTYYEGKPTGVGSWVNSYVPPEEGQEVISVEGVVLASVHLRGAISIVDVEPAKNFPLEREDFGFLILQDGVPVTCHRTDYDDSEKSSSIFRALRDGFLVAPLPSPPDADGGENDFFSLSDCGVRPVVDLLALPLQHEWHAGLVGQEYDVTFYVDPDPH